MVSTPVRDVDAPRAHPPDRLRRRCSAWSPPASSSRTPGGHRVGERPVERDARARLVGVDEHDVDRAVADRGERGIAGGEPLDHERHALADPADVGHRLAARGAARRRARACSRSRRPAPCASSRNTPTVMTPGGQPVEDLADRVGRDLARAAGREVEAERVGTERDGEERVLLVRDPADLDPHRVSEGTGARSRPRVHSRLMDATAAPARTQRRVRDWLPIARSSWSRTRCCTELGDDAGRPARTSSRSSVSTSGSFGGTVARPSRLQRELWDPGDPHWYDYPAWLVYLSHFVVTLAVAIVLWFGDLPRVPPLPRAAPHGHVRRVRHLRGLPRDPAVAGEHPGRHAAHRAHRAGDLARTSGLVGRRRGVRREEHGTRSRSARCRRCTRRGRSWCMLFFWPRAGRWRIAARRATRSRWRSRSCTPPTTSCSTSCSAGSTPTRRLRPRRADADRRGAAGTRRAPRR